MFDVTKISISELMLGQRNLLICYYVLCSYVLLSKKLFCYSVFNPQIAILQIAKSIFAKCNNLFSHIIS